MTRAIVTRDTKVACTLVALAWAALRWWMYNHAGTIEFTDSASYLHKAASPLWSPGFFFGDGRFFVVPLVYKVAALLGPSKDWLTASQLVLSLASWPFLAWTVARRAAPGWLVVASFAAVLVLGLTGSVAMWDRAILSESVTTSALVVLVAVWLRMGEGVTTVRSALLAVAAGVWSMAREANALVLLPFGVVLVLWSIWYLRDRRQRIACWLVASVFVGFVAMSTAVSGQGERWVIPLLNVIGKRVLPDPARTAFYEARGMPMNAALKDMTAEFAGGRDLAFFTSPDLEAFRVWLRAQGRRTYAEDLLAHPASSLTDPLQDVSQFVCPDLKPYVPYAFRPVLPLSGEWLCAPPRATAVVIASLLLGAALLVAAWWTRDCTAPEDGFWLATLAAMFLGWVPFVWFTWHAIGGMETGRHVLTGTFELQVACVLLVLFAARRFARTWSLVPGAGVEPARPLRG